MSSVPDHYRYHQFQYDNPLMTVTGHQSPKSLELTWDHQQLLRSPMSPMSSSSLSWDQQSKSSASPWSPTNSSGFSSLPTIEATANNTNNLMTSSMTTTYCSSIGSCSGGEVIFLRYFIFSIFPFAFTSSPSPFKFGQIMINKNYRIYY